MNLVKTRWLRTSIAVATFSLFTLLSANTIAATSKPKPKSESIPSSAIKKTDKSKPASKIEIISAVKKKYKKIRILSVRKKYKTRGNDCHHVKIVNKKGKISLIHVACS